MNSDKTRSKNPGNDDHNHQTIIEDGKHQDDDKQHLEKLKKYLFEQFMPNEWPKKYIYYDLRLTLFASALYSLKMTTILKPYPAEYFDHNNQEIDRAELIKAFEEITGPTPSIFTNDNDKQSSCNFDRKSVRLIHWILTHGSFELRNVKLNDIDAKAREILESNFEEHRSHLRPNYLFQLIPSSNSNRQRKFNQLSSEYGTFYAFHGSPMENFHSILHNGLIFNLNKRSLLGVGTYLSSKIDVAILFSPFGVNYFRRSRLGKKLSCVALCEIIDHPDIETKKKKDTYYVISNDELVRVAYLLLYSSDSSTNILHHLNVSSIPFGKPETIETTTTSNLVFIATMFMFIFIGFFMTKSTDL